ncbi:putative glycolipid-binding domain-containing protein [Falsirhodobacter sp. 1013]|uniref:putative glycolipid-binding domain-containing protein n=1 Tax=Falsirhodobacter sp. 1013 TaxID=3417566 RepID=UPI003EBB1BF3
MVEGKTVAVVLWTDWEGHGLEQCHCREGDDGLVLEGVVAGTRHGAYGAYYLVSTDADFKTRQVRVVYVGGASLHVEADGRESWHDVIGNRPLPELNGCTDVDLGITPTTNTLPIKRLKLQEQESRDIVVAYVALPDQIDGDFLPRRAEQRYTCLTLDRRYRYEGLFRAFTAELDIDDAGLVRDYPDTLRRAAIE